MKRLFMLAAILFTSALILGACGDDDKKDESNKEVDETETDKEDSWASDDSSSEEEDDSASEEDEDNNDSDSEKDGSFKVETEDQLDLGLGDTGKFDTTLGSYEFTLDNAKLIEKEFDGEESDFDDLILLDITMKNTSNESQNIDDLLEDMEVTNNLEGSGSYDRSIDFDSVDFLTGELESDAETSGQIIVDVLESEEYYLRKTPGNVASGSSNQVIWTIKADEAK